MVKKNEMTMVPLEGRGDGVEERRRDRDTRKTEDDAGGSKWRWPFEFVLCVERKEGDVCGKKEGNGEMGKMGIFDVCGKE